MLVTSIYCFSSNLFKHLYIQDYLTLSQTSPGFYVSTVQIFENTVGKGEIAHNEQFLLSPSVFYPFEELSAILIKFEIVVCKLFQFGRVQNLSFGKVIYM